MEERKYCVYKHTSPSNKVYIGITCRNTDVRWRKGKGYPNNKHFTNAINKYGWENFTHEILFTNLSKEEACQKEIELIAFYKSNQFEFGYNQSTGGENPANGRKYGPLSPDTRRKLSENNACYWKGKKRSSETCQKISEANKGQVPWMKGKSSKMRGIPRSLETKRKISESNTGKKRTSEQKRNMSEIAKKERFEKAQDYKKYKANGGVLSWNEFQKEYKNIKSSLN